MAPATRVPPFDLCDCKKSFFLKGRGVLFALNGIVALEHMYYNYFYRCFLSNHGCVVKQVRVLAIYTSARVRTFRSFAQVRACLLSPETPHP